MSDPYEYESECTRFYDMLALLGINIFSGKRIVNPFVFKYRGATLKANSR
jgi:hypothetical protein